MVDTKQLTIRQAFDRYTKREHDKLFPVFCRITDHNAQYTKEFILEKLWDYECVIVSYEVANNAHYHVLVLTSEENKKNRRQNFQNKLKKLFPELCGNKDYAITDTKTDTHEKLASYVIKEGDYVSKGFTEEELDAFKKMSYKKLDKKKFVDEFEEIKNEYLTDILSEVQFLEKYCVLKANYNQVINPTYVCQVLNTLNVRKHGPENMGYNLMQRYRNQFN